VQPVIRVSGVSKRFVLNRDKSLKERLISRRRTAEHVEEFWALRDVSFELNPSHTLGLIGANGSGKSTLLKLIGGILTPNEGFVERRGRLAALLELGSGFHGDLTGRENVFLNASILGIGRKETERLFDTIVEFSGIEPFIDTQVKFYSSGMYVRLAFAVAVHVDPEILLIDEVLAVGDEPFQRKCMERIKEFQREGRTIIFVTHGLDLVRQLCDRVIMLEHGKVVVDGTPVDALRAFRDMYQQEVVAIDEEGSRRIEVKKVVITDGDGNPKERFNSGERLGIELEVVANEPTDDWEAGIAIFNHLDVMIHGVNTIMYGVDTPPLTDHHRLKFTFDEIPMIEGQYMITVALHNREQDEQYHRLERTTSFRVFNPANEVGVLHMNGRFSVENA
jgi:ABC-2 type transport system ATP-binding protein